MAKRTKKKNKSEEILLFIVKIAFVVLLFMIALKFISIYPWILVFPLSALIIFICICIFKMKKKRETRLFELERTSSIAGLFNEFATNPQEFENYIAKLYEEQGFKTTVTKGSNDGGKDIIMSKDGVRCVVEVKLYATNNKIGRERIQKLHSAMYDEKANKAIFVTTSEFTAPAIDYAEKFGIELVNGEKLVIMIKDNKNRLLEKPSNK